MALLNILTNVRYWIVLGVVLAFLIGSWGPSTSILVIIILMIQMTLSMDGLSLRKSDLIENKKPIIWSVVASMVICSASALAVGAFFITAYPDIWKGWVMLASVPAAVSVITVALYMKGNMVMTVLSTTVIYLIALLFTPLLTYVFIGNAISPLEIFKYVLLFIAVPILATIPLKKVKINRNVKLIVINAMMFLLILLSVGFNKNYIFGEPMVVLYVVIASFVRIFIVSFVMVHLLKKIGCSRNNGVIYVAFAVWKNSGLATTLCLVLLTDAAEAVIPCVISLLIETLWFAVMASYINRLWPEEEPLAIGING